jgi:hypothetical protein
MTRNALFIALCAVLSACPPPTPAGGESRDAGASGNDAGGRIGTTPTNAAELMASLSRLICDFQWRCQMTRGKSAVRTSAGGSLPERSECERDAVLSFANLRAAIEAGRVTYNQAQFSACATAITSGACSGDTIGASCDPMVPGTVAQGDPCFFSGECSGDTQRRSCEKAGGEQCGACALGLAPASVGQSCGGETHCERGLECDFETEVCRARPAPKTAGEACTVRAGSPLYSDCDGSADLVCIAAVCRPMRFSDSVGEPCGDAIGTYCEGGLVCPRAEDGAAQTCRRAGAPGDACYDGQTRIVYPCASNAFCDGNTGSCAAKRANGLACTSYLQCESGNCPADVCAAETDRPREAYQICD